MKKFLKLVDGPTPKAGEVVKSARDRNPRMDGWSNLVTLLGTSADKRTQNQLTWDYHPPEFYEQIYAGGGIPARIVDVVPDHAMRNWVSWINLQKKTKQERDYAREAIEERCLEIDLRGNFLKTWKWGRAYGGAVLHIVTDTSDPSSPLRRGEKVLALRDLSRWDVRILTTDVEYDFGSPNYGHPRIYYLNVQMGAQYKGYPIHWSRMVRFDGQLVPRRTYIRNNYWHDSVLNRVYNSIRNYEGSNDAVAAMLHDFNVDIYKFNNLANLIGAGKEQIVKNRVEMMSYTKSVINAMILDTKDEDYENKQRSVEGVADLLKLQANRLVADTDIPHTILLGESPDGSNATGNSTSQQWYNFLTSEQEHVAKPKLNRLIDIIFPDIEDLRPKFKPLRVLDEVETADVRYKTAQTDQLYIDTGVLDPSEITESRFGGDEYSSETELDEDAREEGLIGPGSDEFEEGDPGPSNEGEETEEPKSTSKKEPGPSDKTEEKNKKPQKKSADITGRGRAAMDAEQGEEASEIGFNAGKGESEFEPRNTEIRMGNFEPKTQSFISQTMSEPFRDPKTDPQIKGPGIPNKGRTVLPTRGTGITAPSGFDFEKDAGQAGSSREGTQIEPLDTKNRKTAYDSKDQPASTRAAQIIVRKGDSFLMGKRDDGKWAFPGGHVEEGESHHQGARRELMEETGIDAKKLGFLGGRMVEPKQGHSVHINLYQHHVDDAVEVTHKLDPDKEFSELKWVNSKKELPEEISSNLAHPNNVALHHMGLLK